MGLLLRTVKSLLVYLSSVAASPAAALSDVHRSTWKVYTLLHVIESGSEGVKNLILKFQLRGSMYTGPTWCPTPTPAVIEKELFHILEVLA